MDMLLTALGLGWMDLVAVFVLLGAVSSLQSNAIGLVPYASLAGGTGVVPTMRGNEAASQSFVKGAVLINSSGKIATASADPTDNIIGVAAEPASGVTDDPVTFYPALPGLVFEATLEDQSNEDHALVISNVFSPFALQVDDDGIWYVDENDGSNTGVFVVGVKDWDDVVNAKVRARVLVTFIYAKTIYA